MLGSSKSDLRTAVNVAAIAASTLPGLASSAWADDIQLPQAPNDVPAHVLTHATLERAISVESISDFIAQWNSDSQLYVQGAPVTPEILQQISTFLQGHPNWSVYLVERAKGEVYTDSGNLTYSGAMAVIQGLRTGLSLKPEFLSVVDPATGKHSGAVLLITFDSDAANRKVAYYSSELQSLAGVGWERWEGDLDQLAIKRLTTNRDVLGAVTDVVSYVDSNVKQAVENPSLFSLDKGLGKIEVSSASGDNSLVDKLVAAGVVVGSLAAGGLALVLNGRRRADRWQSAAPSPAGSLPAVPKADASPLTASVPSAPVSNDLAAMNGSTVAELLSAIQARRALDPVPSVLEGLEAVGLLASISAAEYGVLSDKNRAYTALQEKKGKIEKDFAIETRRAEQLAQDLGSGAYRAEKQILLDNQQVATEERNYEETVARLNALHREYGDLLAGWSELRSELKGFAELTRAGDRYYTLTSRGATTLGYMQTCPSSSETRSFGDIFEFTRKVDEAKSLEISLRDKVSDVGRRMQASAFLQALGGTEEKALGIWTELYNQKGVTSEAASILTLAALKHDVPTSTLIATFNEIFAVQHLGAVSAASMVSASLSGNTPVSELIDRWKRFYAIESLGDIAAGMLASVPVRESTDLDVLESDFKLAFKEKGLADIGSAMIAVLAHEQRQKGNSNTGYVNSIIEKWRELYKVEGCDDVSSVLLASLSLDKNIPVEMLIKEWKQAHALEGINSVSAAAFVATAHSGQGALAGLLEEFRFVGKQFGLSRSAAPTYLTLRGEWSHTVHASEKHTSAVPISSTLLSTGPSSGYFVNQIWAQQMLLMVAASASSGGSHGSISSSSWSSSSSASYGGGFSGGGGFSASSFSGGGGIGASGW